MRAQISAVRTAASGGPILIGSAATARSTQGIASPAAPTAATPSTVRRVIIAGDFMGVPSCFIVALLYLTRSCFTSGRRTTRAVQTRESQTREASEASAFPFPPDRGQSFGAPVRDQVGKEM